jgi:quercetin dioxygenase-like cupin family protein
MSSKEDWPDELDALIAAPEYHSLLFENEFVRVLDTNLPPGKMVQLHTHRWPSTLYILSWSDFVRRDGGGEIVIDSRMIGKVAKGSAVWSEPLAAHTLENVGDAELRVISIEVKTAR